MSSLRWIHGTGLTSGMSSRQLSAGASIMRSSSALVSRRSAPHSTPYTLALRPTAAFITPTAAPRSLGQLRRLVDTETMSMVALLLVKMKPAARRAGYESWMWPVVAPQTRPMPRRHSSAATARQILHAAAPR